MNRQYSIDQYVNMVGRVREKLDQPAISTDIIVGFPGESEEDFQATLDIARHAGFIKIHAFPFSPRQRTAAARWQRDFIESPVVRRRMGILAELDNECSIDFRRRFLGTVQDVLVESEKPTCDDAGGPSDMRHGRTGRYFEVHFEAGEVQPGSIVPVRIDRITPTRTHGTYLDRAATSLPLPVLPSHAVLS